MEKRTYSNIELSAMIRAFTGANVGTGYALAVSRVLWPMRPPTVEQIPISMSEAASIAAIMIAQVENE